MNAATKGCLAGTGVCFVSHRGEVFPCGYLPVEAGHVRATSFQQIWQHSPLFDELRNPNALSGKCGLCEFKKVCGGCRARAYGMATRGAVWRASPIYSSTGIPASMSVPPRKSRQYFAWHLQIRHPPMLPTMEPSM